MFKCYYDYLQYLENPLNPRPTKTGPFVIFVCLMPDVIKSKVVKLLMNGVNQLGITFGTLLRTAMGMKNNSR